jgi:hypothetical protein
MLQVNIQDVFFQSAVKSRSLLPLVGNSLKDVRFAQDEKKFYFWTIENAYGNISSWVGIDLISTKN